MSYRHPVLVAVVTAACLSAAAPARPAETGEGGVVTAERLPVYDSARGDRQIATLTRGDAFAAVASLARSEFAFVASHGRVWVLFFTGGGDDARESYGWIDPAGIARLTYGCSCGGETGCLPTARHGLRLRATSWNACFLSARDRRLAELGLAVAAPATPATATATPAAEPARHPATASATPVPAAAAGVANVGAQAPASPTLLPVSIRHARGSFDVTLSPQEPEDVRDGSSLGRRSIAKVFHGDLEGTSKGQMLSAGTDVQGSAGYAAIERVTGALGGRRGSFVLLHRGVMARGEPELSITVVPDSGSGGLAGISGSMSIEIAAGGQHSYDLAYTLPETPE